MHVWFISHNFPPEVNALATRTYEHAREWAKSGHSFDVITDVPHFPEGKIHNTYQNRFQHDSMDGISTYRVPIYPAENRRRIRRTLSYVSFMVSCILFSPWIKKRPSIVVASSPQIFTAFAGYLLSVIYRVPFVMEVRDLWPQSIGAVGAIRGRYLLKLVDLAVNFLYRQARLIVVLTHSFREEIASKGIATEKMVVIPNGISSEFAEATVPDEALSILRNSHGMAGKFIASYIGTIGLAHGLETLLEAARLVEDPRILFLILGTGAARRDLEARLARNPQSNVLLLPKVPRDEVRAYLQLSDVSLVILRDSPVFLTVIPSKMLESMGCGKPVILGVKGEALEILERCQGGMGVEPECPADLAKAVQLFAKDAALREQFAERGKAKVLEEYNRSSFAKVFWRALEAAID